MRLSLIVLVLVLLPGLALAAGNRRVDAIEDNDFAEFEESDDDDGQLTLHSAYLICTFKMFTVLGNSFSSLLAKILYIPTGF